jgi:hypothetical protein
MGFVSAAMGLVKLFGAKSEASAAKKAGKAQAAQEQDVTQEKIFQLKKQERAMAGQTRSAAAGSGVKADQGSVVDILAEQAETFKHEREVTQRMGAQRSQSAWQRGQDVASAAMFKGVSGMLSSFAQAGQATAQTGSFFKFG